MNKIIKPNLLLRKRVAELEGAILPTFALDNHILKKPKNICKTGSKKRNYQEASAPEFEL
ncbi:MAG: hypothetical protein HS129_05765 [Leptospiraceae bacterium]|nr:hypothetical protein [Leptospiraceae bacterium]